MVLLISGEKEAEMLLEALELIAEFSRDKEKKDLAEKVSARIKTCAALQGKAAQRRK